MRPPGPGGDGCLTASRSSAGSSAPVRPLRSARVGVGVEEARDGQPICASLGGGVLGGRARVGGFDFGRGGVGIRARVGEMRAPRDVARWCLGAAAGRARDGGGREVAVACGQDGAL